MQNNKIFSCLLYLCLGVMIIFSSLLFFLDEPAEKSISLRSTPQVMTVTVRPSSEILTVTEIVTEVITQTKIVALYQRDFDKDLEVFRTAIEASIEQELVRDPLQADTASSTLLIERLFTSLTAVDSAGRIVPSLAQKWSVSDDKLTWTFKLNPKIRWVYYDKVDKIVKSVRTVNANDVRFGLLEMLNPKNGFEYPKSLYVIRGAEAYHSAFGDRENVAISVLDSHTLEIVTEEPASYFPALMSSWFVVPRFLSSEDKDQRLTNGPFVIMDWNTDKWIYLIKNPYWPDQARIPFDVYGGLVVESKDIALTLYERGTIDVLGELSPKLFANDLNVLPELEIQHIPQPCTYTYIFAPVAPFDSADVRRAFAMAIDRDELVGQNYIFGKPAFALIPYNESDIRLQYNVEEAKRLWLKSGYADQAVIEIRLLYSESPQHENIARMLKKQWENVFVNLNISVEGKKWEYYSDEIETIITTPTLFRATWCEDYHSHYNWLHDFFKKIPSSGANIDAEFQDAVKIASVSFDTKIRSEGYNFAERILVEEQAFIIPIYHFTHPYLLKKKYDFSWLSALTYFKLDKDVSSRKGGVIE